MAFTTACSKRFSCSARIEPVSFSVSAISSHAPTPMIPKWRPNHSPNGVAVETLDYEFAERGDEPVVDGLFIVDERCERRVQSTSVMVPNGGTEQILLAGEVKIETRTRNACSPGDLIHGRFAIPIPREYGERGME